MNPRSSERTECGYTWTTGKRTHRCVVLKGHKPDDHHRAKNGETVNEGVKVTA